MTYASTTIDRRADYYARAAAVIAADPLDFYTRAEKGRKFQANGRTPRITTTAGKPLRAVAAPSLALVPVDPARASRSSVLAA